jgi:hypothetical protein
LRAAGCVAVVAAAAAPASMPRSARAPSNITHHLVSSCQFYNRHENSSDMYCHRQYMSSSNNSCRLSEVVEPDNS